MKSILSTKKLKPNQRDILLRQGFSVVDYNAIEIEFVDFEIPDQIQNAIFTSQNGVKGFLKTRSQSELVEDRNALRQAQGDKLINCFCVGQKTKALLEENNFKVIKMAQNSKELGEFIVNNHKNKSFHYFCGAQRRDELPTILKASNITISEVKTYKTILKPKKFDQNWDGILFFSPSGVESFAQGQQDPQGFENPVGLSAKAICIGETTAEAAKKYSNNVMIANATSVESVIAKAVKTLKNNLSI